MASHKEIMKKEAKNGAIRAYHKRKDERFAKRYGSRKCDVQGGQEIGDVCSSQGRSLEKIMPVGHAGGRSGKFKQWLQQQELQAQQDWQTAQL